MYASSYIIIIMHLHSFSCDGTARLLGEVVLSWFDVVHSHLYLHINKHRDNYVGDSFISAFSLKSGRAALHHSL